MLPFVKTFGLSSVFACGVCFSCDSASACCGGGCCGTVRCCRPAVTAPDAIPAPPMDHSGHQASMPTRQRYQSAYQAAPPYVPQARTNQSKNSSYELFRADRKFLGLYR